MKDINSLGISHKYGLVKIIEEEKNTYKILLADSNSFVYEDKINITLVDLNFISSFINHDIDDYFDLYTIKKSENYIDKFNDFTINNNLITANIKLDFEDITAIIKKSNYNELSFLCTCQDTINCKHTAALFSLLQKQYKNLFSIKEEHQSQKDFGSTYAEYAEDKYRFSSAVRMLLFIKENFDYDTLIVLYNSIANSEKYQKDTIKDIADMILACFSNHEQLKESIKEIEKTYAGRELYDYISSKLHIKKKNEDETRIIVYRFIINEQYPQLLDYVIKSDPDYLDDFLSITLVEIIYYAFDHVSSILNALESVVRSKHYMFYKPIISKYFSHLTEDEKRYFIKNGKNKNVIDVLSLSDFFKYCMKSLPLEDCLRYVMDNLEEIIGYTDKTQLLQLISKFCKENWCKGIDCINRIISSLDNNHYLYDYFNFTMEANSAKTIYSLLEDDSHKVNKDAFFNYFNLTYEIMDEDFQLQIIYKLNFLDNVVILIKLTNDFDVEVINNLSENEFDYVKFIIDYSSTYFGKEFEQEIKEIKKRAFARQDYRNMELIKSAFNELTSKINSIDNLLVTKTNYINLEFAFEKQNYIRDLDIYQLNLKVGYERLYQVKDIQDFLQLFMDKKNYKYGKDFSFIHDINNIKPSQRQALTLLLNNHNGSHKKVASYTINQSLLCSLIYALKEEKILYNNTEYYPRLEEKELRFYIDENYNFKIKYEPKQFIEILNGEILLFDELNHTIDKVIHDTNSIKLYEFASKINGTCIKPIKKEFVNYIYVLFHNLIDIHESIKNEFKLSILKIETYFDYEDCQITKLTKYKKDDLEIDITAIVDKIDKNLLEIYQSKIKELGFVDDVLDDDCFLTFFSSDLNDLRKVSDVYLSESLSSIRMRPFAVPTIKITHHDCIMKAFLEESIYDKEELYQILAAVKKKKKYVLLSDNRIIDISGKESVEFSDNIDNLNINQENLDEEVDVPNYLYFKIRESKSVLCDDYIHSMIQEISNFKNIKDVQLPPLNATLKQYQIEGFNWLRILSKYSLGGILADDMGLGKTLQIITLFLNDNENKPSLVIAPKSLVFNWNNEIKKFTQQLEVVSIFGSYNERNIMIKSIDENKKVIYITSYDSLRNDIDNYNVEFNYVILDEAQYIKNINAVKTINVKKLKAYHKFALTGTPIENDMLDLWSIFDFVMPNYLPSISDYKKGGSSEEYKEKIAKIVAPFILRRRKCDVLKDLPNKYERIVSSEMTTKQRQIYDAYHQKVKDSIAMETTSFEILPMLTRLRQICVDPQLFAENYENESSKMIQLEEIIEEYIENGHKILIFSQFVKALDIIKEKLTNKGINHLYLTGDTPSSKRIEYMNTFNNDNSIKIFLISLKAGGVGLNLTGADTVIHLDPWWNSSAENQATDRAYRIGQNKNVEVIKLICSNSIEQKVIELQTLKNDLIDKLISHNDSSVTSLSIDNLKALLD